MRFDSLENRVTNLERKSGSQDGLLRFADGSSRAVRIRNPLAVLCACIARISWRIGPPEGVDCIEGAQMSVSRYDDEINLLGGAESIETGDSLLQLVQESAKEAVAES
jgi:hypothetical protein